MVVERIFNIKEIQKNPSIVSAIAFIFVCISVILATMTHQPPMGFFIIALSVIPAIPFFIRMTIWEEKGEEIFIAFICAIPPRKFEKGKREGLVSLYNDIIKLYMYFFLGSIIGFAFTSTIMPEESSKLIFSDIRYFMQSIMNFSSQVLNPLNTTSFWSIFLHNLKLMFIMLLFSIIYSIGAVFLLVFNAAIIALFLETGIRERLANFSSLGIFSYPAAFAVGSFEGILKLLPHGICEFSGFFIASVAGGIISVAIERKAYKRRTVLKIILIDVAKLLLLAILLIAAGAWIESAYPAIESMLPSFLK